jgi:hypothetical protein
MTEQTLPEKQEFVILWIDDQPGSVVTIKKEVTTEFEGKYKDVYLKIIDSEKYADALDKLKTNNVEIVVTDSNLEGEGKDGLDMLGPIRRTNFAIDVLFYHARGTLKQKTKEKIDKNYDFVQIIEGKPKIPEALTNLIDKHLKRFNDIVFLRGMFLSNAIELELKMNVLLATYLEIKPKHESVFHDFIMENSSNQVSGKWTAIENIFTKKGGKKPTIKDDFTSFVKPDEFGSFISKLKVIGTTRNQLAHCKLSKTEYNVLVSGGTDVEFDKKKIDNMLTKIREATNYIDNLIKNLKK